jgi:hypothetical protein
MPNVPKLLLFPKPSPATIHIVRQNITFRIGKETYAMTIHTKIERATAQPVDTPSPDFQRDRESEFRKLECAPPDSDPDADPTRGPSLCAPGGEAGR